jgi:hypothetical protein
MNHSARLKAVVKAFSDLPKMLGRKQATTSSFVGKVLNDFPEALREAINRGLGILQVTERRPN